MGVWEKVDDRTNVKKMALIIKYLYAYIKVG